MSSHATTIDHHHDPTTSTGIPNKKLLMWAFLASDCMFFGSLIATHLIYRLHPPVDNLDPQKVFAPQLTSFSTFILLMSSLMMALAVNAIQKGNVKSTRVWLLGTIICGLMFLGCQVFEFNEFYYVKHMSLSNSILGSTFFVLTGTHGTHVAIGVLWLALMYVRTFKPLNADSGWFLRSWLHVGVLTATIIFAMRVVIRPFLDLFVWAHVAAAPGAEEVSHTFMQTMGELAAGVGHNYLSVIGFVVGLIVHRWFTRPRGPVAFDQHNAIDVEGMGLYWHFVDIVWIVIFTAVYLIEFIGS